MSISNKRKKISETKTPEQKLKQKLRENYSQFLNEEGDEEMDDMPIEDDVDDMDMGGDDMDMAGDDSMGAPMADEVGGEEFENLSDQKKAQIDDWVDTLLSDTLDNEGEYDGTALDTEMPADEMDSIDGDVVEGVPISSDDMNNIIASDDSLHALEDELVAMSQQEIGDDMENDGLDELEPDEEIEETVSLNEEDDALESMDDAEPLNEDVALAKDNKDAGFDEVAEGLNDKMTNKVGDKKPEKVDDPLAKGKVDAKPNKGNKNDANKSALKESEEVRKSKLLVKAATVIAEQSATIKDTAKQLKKLQLENYRLSKANSVLAAAGDRLNKDARVRISESFDKCDSKENVDTFYNKLVENIRQLARPSLNEAVSKTKTTFRKEAKQEVVKEKLSREQMRKNMLMGLSTDEDMYYSE